MNNILTEKEYQHFIMDRLSQDNGYVVRKATSYDRLFAMDRELLFQFLNDTQPDEMAALRKIYKADLEDTLVSFINAETTKARGSLLDVLKHGIEISNMKLELMYTKPATTFNQELLAKYEKNIFSVMEEVWASNDERVDLVIFLNDIAIMSFELKCNAAGQSYQDAIYQYRVDRDPKTRLFWFKAGCLVNFAMDLNLLPAIQHGQRRRRQCRCRKPHLQGQIQRLLYVGGHSEKGHCPRPHQQVHLH